METYQYLLKKQREYCISQGGILGLREADEVYNNLNIQIIKAFKTAHKNCRLVKLHPEKGEEYITEYTGQHLYNDACDAIIPNDNKALLDLLIKWDKDRLPSNFINELFTFIESNGGIIFVWK